MEINKIQNLVAYNGIIFISYGGLLTQALITSMTEALEREALANDLTPGVSNNLFTVFIEMSQNIMKYSLNHYDNINTAPGGLIVVSKKHDEEEYFVDSLNLINIEDIEVISCRLDQIQQMDKEDLRKVYRELRRSGRDSHENGGGIGFYEIAKRCDRIEYKITPQENGSASFHLKAVIKPKEKLESKGN